MAEIETTYFLDTSALVKLYHQEQGTELVEGLAADQTVRMWLSELARVELHSVFIRKTREGELVEADLQRVSRASATTSTTVFRSCRSAGTSSGELSPCSSIRERDSRYAHSTPYKLHPRRLWRAPV